MGCAGSDLFSVPSREQVPFQLFIQFITRKSTDTGFAYSTDMRSSGRTPIFVAYNLFTLRADQVFYDQARSLKATGNVVIANETGSTRQADSMTLKIENGEAIALP
jgi:lipopolysaccharide assembly outer membrane protein LptD (OstA)